MNNKKSSASPQKNTKLEKLNESKTIVTISVLFVLHSNYPHPEGYNDLLNIIYLSQIL